MTDVSFSKPEVVLSHPRLKYVVEIWFAYLVFDLLEAMTSLNLKPEVVLRYRSNCHEFQNYTNNHITVIGMLLCISLTNCIEIGPPAA